MVPRRPRTSDSARAEQLAVFGPPPLLEGEDPAAYNEFLMLISTDVKPTDILEDIWVREIADLVWEILRLRRLKSSLLNAMMHGRLRSILESLPGRLNVAKLANDWAARKPRAIEKVNRLLKKDGWSVDIVTALTLREELDSIERIERLTAVAEARRNAILREIDRHRATLADALRRTVQNIEDTQNQFLDTKSAKRSSAA